MDWRKFIENTIRQMLGSVSANLLVNLREFAVKFREDARATENPWDDILADFMCGLLGIPGPEA